MLKITKNPNGDIVKEIKAKLRETSGNCPCVLPPFWNDETQCPCKKFREQDHEGECCCGLYIKVNVNEES